MDLELTDEQRWLDESVRQLLDRTSGEDAWPALVEFGVLGIASGTDGLGAVELALVGRALGRALASVPFIDSVAARYGTRPRASSRGSAFAQLHAGEDIASLCLLEPGAGWDLERSATIITSNGEATSVIEGHKVAVHHAAQADSLLVSLQPGGRATAGPRSPGSGRGHDQARRFDRQRGWVGGGAARGGSGAARPRAVLRGKRNRAGQVACDRRRAGCQRGSRGGQPPRRAGSRLCRRATPVRPHDRKLPGAQTPARRHVRQANERLVDGAVRCGSA